MLLNIECQMTFHTRVVDDLKGIHAIQGQWELLLEGCNNASIFSTPEWYLSWFEAMSDNVTPQVVLVEDADRTLKAVLPLARIRERTGPVTYRVTEMAGNTVASGDHLGLICPAKNFDQAWKAIEEYIRRELTHSALFRMWSMDDPALIESLKKSAQTNNWSIRQIKQDIAPKLALPETYDDYLKSYSAKSRQTLKRKWRKISKAFPSLVVSRNDETKPLDTVLSEIAHLHTKLWNTRGHSGNLMNPKMQTFLHQFCNRALDKGWLRLHQILVQDQLIAGIIVFHWRDQAYYYQSGWDIDNIEFSPGDLMLDQSIHTAIDEGKIAFDFLRGDEEYKSRFKASPELLFSYELASGTLGRSLIVFSKIKKHIKQFLKRVLPEKIVSKLSGH